MFLINKVQVLYFAEKGMKTLFFACMYLCWTGLLVCALTRAAVTMAVGSHWPPFSQWGSLYINIYALYL